MSTPTGFHKPYRYSGVAKVSVAVSPQRWGMLAVKLSLTMISCFARLSAYKVDVYLYSMFKKEKIRENNFKCIMTTVIRLLESRELSSLSFRHAFLVVVFDCHTQ